MKKELVRRLLLFIVDQLQDLEAPISTIRLIKILYLIDYEHYLRYEQTLTSIQWVRYDYGPYFFSWPEILKSTRLDLDPREFVVAQAGYKGVTYRTRGDHQVEDILDYSTERLVHRIIEHWAFEDAQTILDYVYFETEPMQSSEHEELLDFTKILRDFERRRQTKTIKLSEEVSKQIQVLLKEKRECVISEYPLPIYDDVYYDAIYKMEQEETISREIIGKVRISTNPPQFFPRNLE